MIGKLNHVGVATPSIDEAVKMYRDRFRVGLKEAKEAVERIGAQNGIPASSGSGCLGVILLGIAVVVGLLN